MRSWVHKLATKLTRRLHSPRKPRLNRRSTIMAVIAGFIILILSPVLYFGLTNPDTTDAWFDDSFANRQYFSFTHNANIAADRAVTFSLDTAELIAAGVMQADCDDTRFTDINGQHLIYELTGTCNNAATTYEVVFPQIFDGLNAGYVYYNNPSANSAESITSGYTALTPSGGDPGITTRTAEQQAPSPVAYWKFDENQGQVASDSTSQNNDGQLGATSGSEASDPTWKSGSECISGSCLQFDGTDDFVNLNSGATQHRGKSVITVSTWIEAPVINTGNVQRTIIADRLTDGDLKNWQHALWQGKPYFSFWSSNSERNCQGDTVLTANTWYNFSSVYDGSNISLYLNGYLVKTCSATGVIDSDAAQVDIGRFESDGSQFWEGLMDEIKIYPYARTAAQIKTDYIKGAGASGSTAVLGAKDQSVLTDGLVGWWKMDDAGVDAEGETSPDASGNANTGTLYGDNGAGDNGTGMTCTSSGKFGSGCDFDGVDDRIDINSTVIPSVGPTSTLTISAWVKSDTSQSGEADRRAAVSNSNTYEQFAFELGLPYSGSNKFSLEVGSAEVGTQEALALSTFSTNTWYFLTGVLKNGSADFYVNGVLQSSIVYNATTNSGTSGNMVLTIGLERYFGSYWYPWDGQVDDVRIYNRALSPAEVRQLYAYAPGPVAYWSMDDTTSNTVYDTSGNNKHITDGNGNATKTAGKIGSAREFLTSGEAMETTNLSNEGSTAFTADAWIYPYTGGFATREIPAIVGLWNPVNDHNFFFYFNYETHNLGLLRGGWGTNYREWSCSNSLCTIPLNLWSHVAVVVEDDNILKFYVNGILAQSYTAPSSTSGSATYDSTGTFYGVGGNDGWTSSYWNGLIDEVKIYNYARTPSQIIEDMNGGHPVGGSPVGSSVGYWKFDEGYGTTANDVSTDSNDNDLTLSAASWTTSGKFGSGWNGTGSVWLSRADDADFDFSETEDFSISGWFKTDAASNPGATEYLVDKSSATVAGYSVYFNTSGFLCFGIDDDTTWSPDIASCTTTDIYDNTWHSFVAIRDYSGTDKTYLYVDGILKDSDSDSTTATLVNSETLYLGDDDGDATNSFAGDLDELKIYRAALTPEQVLTEYNHGKAITLGVTGVESSAGAGDHNAASQSYCPPGSPAACTPPVAHWKMDEKIDNSCGGSADVCDTSGNEYHGTQTGDPVWKSTGHCIEGACLEFAGGDYLTVNENGDFSTNIFTTSAWIYRQEDQDDEELIISNQDSSSDGFKMFVNGISSWETFKCQWNSTDLASDTQILPGSWYHVACTSDGTTIKGYVNGVEEMNFTATPSMSETTDLTIGSNSYTPSNYWKGKIDDVRIYDYARTPAQIAWDYNRGAPIAHYKLDECQGTTAYNSTWSANGAAGNNGTITIGTGGGGSNTSPGTCSSGTSTEAWNNGTSGKRSASLDFDGTDDYVSVADTSMLDITSNISISTWVNLAGNLPSGNTKLIGKWNETGNQRSYALALQSGNPVIFYISSDGGASICSSSSTSTLSLSTWYHLVAVYNGTDCRVYINGAQNGTPTAFSSGIYSGSANLIIGGSGGEPIGGQNTYVDGQIDDVKIYNYALTAKQVQLEYNGGAVNFGP